MEGRQNVYYALGILAYAIARADGKVQDVELKALSSIIRNEVGHNIDFEYAGIIFELLNRDNPSNPAIYDWAMKEMVKSRHYITAEIAAKMISTIEKVADAYDKTSPAERKLIDRFRIELSGIVSPHPIE